MVIIHNYFILCTRKYIITIIIRSMKKKQFKRKYEKPTSRTIELQQRAKLLVGSMGDRDNYTPTSNNPFA